MLDYSSDMTLDWEALETAAQAQSRNLKTAAPIWRRLSFANGEPAAAYLFSLSQKRPRLAIPVRFGRTVFGRRVVARSCGIEPNEFMGMVEGAQWEIVFEDDTFRVRDIRSTNGGALIPKAARDRVPLGLGEAEKHPEAFCLGWDGTILHEEFRPLFSGDVLVSIFNAFLFIQ